jgi:uncharacterized protein
LIIGWLAFLLMGLTLGLIGGGGSILTVPILVYLYGMSAQDATGASLFVVGATAFVGALAAYFKKEIQLSKSLPFAIPSLFGVFLARSFLVPWTPDPVLSLEGFTISKDLLLMLLFAVLMVTASTKMIRSSNSVTGAKSSSMGLIGLQGFLVGVITGFVGAGGGFLIIPALVFLIGLSMRQAAGTSLLIIAMNSGVGFLGDLMNRPDKNWSLLLSAVLIAIFGLFIGRKLAPSFSEKALKKIFGWFVLVLGTAILLDQFF